jgi:hypothetical protein
MKKEINTYMRKSISNWDNIYRNGILIYDWPKVADRFKDFKFDFEIPEDIKTALLSIHPNNFEEMLNYKGLTEWLGDSSIYELLTGTSKYDYTLEEGRDLVKWYIISYWSSQYK